ncbi:uL13 family ribosomal protein, partial [Microgenomates group bacterium]|nr:uL13 family ribosomal protein [Microgenomates group bacterium]
MTTYATKLSDIKRAWHLFDAKNQVLGRLATQVAVKLIGK